MKDTLHVDARDASVARLLGSGFKGREAQIRASLEDGEPFTFHGNSWDGGSRSEYTVVRLATGERVGLPSNGFHQPDPSSVVPRGHVVVEFRVFCGKRMPPMIHAHAADLAPLLPAKAELTEEQARVLICTASLKSSYNGRPIRVEYSGLGRERWERVKAECIARGWLRKNGAITRDGRNAIEGHPDRNRADSFRGRPID